MRLSIAELAQVREEVSHLLDELHLDAYLFDVEPQEEQWAITVECGMDGEWTTVQLSADKQLLLGGADDPTARRVLLDAWAEALAACRTAQ